jgi:hypothetical protein
MFRQVTLTRRHLSHLAVNYSAYEVDDALIGDATMRQRIHSTNEWRKVLVRTTDAALYEASEPAATGRISADGPAQAQGMRDLVSNDADTHTQADLRSSHLGATSPVIV